jgi:D-alanine-D-alanine ligase
MRVAIIYNEDFSNVINVFGMQNKETYNPKTVQRVGKALEKNGHNVEIIDGDMDVIDNLRSFLPRVQDGERFGIVFNMAYGIQGESRYTHIPAMLEMLGIPYVGSSPAGHALALDKVITKVILQRHGIPTPDFWVFNSADEDVSEVGYPVIVKPKMESVSFGLRVVDNAEDLRDAIEFVTREFNQQALVEQFIPGREFAVGLLGNEPLEILPVLEIDLDGDPNGIQTVDDKRHTPRRKLCPAPVDESLAEEIRRISAAVFRSLGLKDFARVDLRVDAEGKVYVLEVNSMASLGASGSYVHAAGVAGYNFDRLVNRMLEVAALRYFIADSSGAAAPGGKVPLATRIRGYVRSRTTALEGLLKEMVDTNAHVKNVSGIEHLGTIIQKRLAPLGFTSEVFPQTEIGNMMYLSNAPRPRVLVLGFLDGDVTIRKHRYFRAGDLRWYGSGIWEHKGGLAVLVAALQALSYTRALKKAGVGILLVSDETIQNPYSGRLIRERTEGCELLVGLHGASVGGGVVTSRAGSAFYTLAVSQKRDLEAGEVARSVGVFSKILGDWSALSDDDRGLVVAPYDVSMHTSIAQGLFHAEAGLSVRFSDPGEFEDLDRRIRKAIPGRKHKKHLEVHFEGGMRRPPRKASGASDGVFAQVKAIADELDVRVEPEHRWSSAGICLAAADLAVVDGMGPCGTKDVHGDEYVLKHTIYERAQILALLIHHYGIP